MLYKVRDVVRIEPSRLGEPLVKVASEILREKYEYKFVPELGHVLAIYNVKVSRRGKLVLGDGASYHVVVFNALAYMPEEREVVEGSVVDIRSFGVFVRFGPVEGLAHISQILNDHLSYNPKQGVIMGEKTRRILKIGDQVRARIISVSVSGAALKIGLTMRQPFLGKLDWIKEDLEKIKR